MSYQDSGTIVGSDANVRALKIIQANDRETQRRIAELEEQNRALIKRIEELERVHNE